MGASVRWTRRTASAAATGFGQVFVCVRVLMYVCVCVCVCANVCMHVCMYEYMYLFIYLLGAVGSNDGATSATVCMHASMQTCMYACMNICIYPSTRFRRWRNHLSNRPAAEHSSALDAEGLLTQKCSSAGTDSQKCSFQCRSSEKCF